MEVFAGFVEHVDAQAGKLIDELEQLGIRDNTIVLYIFGDNGSSAEGQNGTISELLAQNHIPNTDRAADRGAEQDRRPRCARRPEDSTTCTMPAGPGPATRRSATPSSSPRISAAPAIRWSISWPKGIKPDKTPRSQFHHVNDIVPTIYEVLGIKPPEVVDGFKQDPIDGTSMAYTFADAKAPDAQAHAVLRQQRQPRHLSATAGTPAPSAR